MASIFSKIVAGDIPAYKVAESNEFLAFLDIAPLAEGHLLVIPKKEVDNLFDLDDDTMARKPPFRSYRAKIFCAKARIRLREWPG